MTHVIKARNVNDAFLSGLWWLRTAGVREESRNGPVLVSPGPVMTEYTNPRERVLFLDSRDANHVFHLMEALWMLTGSDDVTPLIPFNSGIVKYTEDGWQMHGAYGHRWRKWGLYSDLCPQDQILEAIEQLRNNPNSRQVVISMWNPDMDLTEAPFKDRPCNTHIYFDCRNKMLNMTVCCRSNDMLWGAYGANVVHMSVLQEVIAAGVGLPMGVYRQFSNNFHLYTDVPMVADLLKNPPMYSPDYYNTTVKIDLPLIGKDETVDNLLEDCGTLIWGDSRVYKTKFVREVADPLKHAYLARKEGEPFTMESIRWCDWKLGFREWINRRTNAGQ